MKGWFSKKEDAVNDRGAAIYQTKNWQRLLLPRPTMFIHCGSAPFAQDTDALKHRLGKEVCTVQGTPEKKFILCFPMLKMTPKLLPEEIVLAKPCQMLWSVEEMPRAFVFQLPTGTEVWTENAELDDAREVGLGFDVVFEDCLIAQFRRVNKAKAQLQPLNGVSWA